MLSFVSLAAVASLTSEGKVPVAPVSAPAPTGATAETSVMGGIGGLAAKSTPGVALAALATHRIGPFELGFEMAAGGGLAHVLGLGAVAGLHVGDRLAVRAFATFGAHGYRHVGRMELLGDDPGVSGTTAYVGGRLMLSYSFSPKPVRARRVLVGLLGAIDRDLERYDKSSSYTATSWLFDGQPQVTSWTHSIGQTSVGVLGVLGVEVDWSPYY